MNYNPFDRRRKCGRCCEIIDVEYEEMYDTSLGDICGECIRIMEQNPEDMKFLLD